MTQANCEGEAPATLRYHWIVSGLFPTKREQLLLVVLLVLFAVWLLVVLFAVLLFAVLLAAERLEMLLWYDCKTLRRTERTEIQRVVLAPVPLVSWFLKNLGLSQLVS
jgi:hypothetical protein